MALRSCLFTHSLCSSCLCFGLCLAFGLCFCACLFLSFCLFIFSFLSWLTRLGMQLLQTAHLSCVLVFLLSCLLCQYHTGLPCLHLLFFWAFKSSKGRALVLGLKAAAAEASAFALGLSSNSLGFFGDI